MDKKIEIFCCYARKDQEFLQHLKAHLSPLQRQGRIVIWADTDISAGASWRDEIKQHLEGADIILLLVSPDFMHSDYCYEIEMQRALERHQRGEAGVIPVILRPCDWHDAPFAHLQCLPQNGKPVTAWDNRDTAFLDIAQGIRRMLEQQTSSTAQTADGVYKGHTDHVYTLAWAPDSNSIVSAGRGGVAQVWNASTCQTIYSYSEHRGRLFPYVDWPRPNIYAVAWSPTGELIVSGGTGSKMLVWTALKGHTRGVYSHSQKISPSIRTLAWSPDGMRIASLCSSEAANREKVVSVWNVDPVQELLRYPMRPGWLNVDGMLAVTPVLAWSPNGELIASTCGDDIIYIWKASTKQSLSSEERLIARWHVGAGMVYALAWSPNGELLAAANDNSTVHVWNRRTGETVFIHDGHTQYVRAVAWSPDGTRIASGSQDETVQIWRLEKGCVYTYYHHTSWVTAVAWSPDGRRIASGSHDGTVHIWQAG